MTNSKIRYIISRFRTNDACITHCTQYQTNMQHSIIECTFPSLYSTLLQAMNDDKTDQKIDQQLQSVNHKQNTTEDANCYICHSKVDAKFALFIVVEPSENKKKMGQHHELQYICDHCYFCSICGLEMSKRERENYGYCNQCAQT